MDITRGIRARQNRPYPGRSLTHPGFYRRWKAPILATAGRKGTSKEPGHALHLPQEITLRLRWEAIARIPAPIAVQCINGDYCYEACDLYDIQAANDIMLATHSNYQAIQLIYQGYGTYQNSGSKARPFRDYTLEDAALNFESGRIFGTSHFQTQTLSPLILRRRYIAEQAWLITLPASRAPSQLNVTPYYGYGVYAPSGTPLENIEQVYARLTTLGDRTAVELKRTSLLQSQGTGPPHGGQHGSSNIIYPDTPHNTETSLASAFVSGAFCFSLCIAEEKITYRSSKYFQDDAASQMFEVVCVPVL